MLLEVCLRGVQAISGVEASADAAVGESFGVSLVDGESHSGVRDSRSDDCQLGDSLALPLAGVFHSSGRLVPAIGAGVLVSHDGEMAEPSSVRRVAAVAAVVRRHSAQLPRGDRSGSAGGVDASLPRSPSAVHFNGLGSGNGSGATLGRAFFDVAAETTGSSASSLRLAQHARSRRKPHRAGVRRHAPRLQVRFLFPHSHTGFGSISSPSPGDPSPPRSRSS